MDGYKRYIIREMVWCRKLKTVDLFVCQRYVNGRKFEAKDAGKRYSWMLKMREGEMVGSRNGNGWMPKMKEI